MKKSFKAIAAAVLSAAMILTPSITSLADDPLTTGATGNVLAYKCETIVVPTALKLAINPNETAVNTKYAALADDATFAAGTKYYTEADGVYSLATVTSDNFASLKSGLFTAVTSTDQIVSFKYGLVSKATAKRNVAISFSVTADSDITFVEDADSATAPTDENDNTHTAEPGELKMFLSIVPGNAVPTADTKKKTADTSITSGKTYYTKAGNDYTKVASPDVANIATYYEDTTAIGAEILPKELADVAVATMSDTPIAFTADGADVAFKLNPATYSLKAGEFIDWDTTQAQYGDKLEITTIGGIASFTISGAMNKDADWTSVDSTIVIEPEYDFTDSDGTETAIDSGLNQIEVPAPSTPATDDYVMTVADGVASYRFVSAPEGSLTAVLVDESDRSGGITAGNVTYANGVLTFNATATTNMGLATGNHTIKATIGDTEYTLTIGE